MMKLLVIGNLGSDAVVNRIQGGATVINFNVAHSEKWKDAAGTQQVKTTWIQASYWTEKVTIAQYLKKGTQVFLEGTPEIKMFAKRDGTTGSSFTLRVLNVQLLGSAKPGELQQTDTTTAKPAVEVRHTNLPPAASNYPDPNSITEPIDDLPF